MFGTKGVALGGHFNPANANSFYKLEVTAHQVSTLGTPAGAAIAAKDVDLREMRFAHNFLDEDNSNATKNQKLKDFNAWAQRFVKVDGQKRLFDGTPTPAQKQIGYQLAFRSKSPVFGMIKGDSYDKAERGTMLEYEPNEVKMHDFIWAAWADASEYKKDDMEKYEMEVSKTLALIKQLLKTAPNNDENVVLQISVPSHVMPTDAEVQNVFRDSFINVVNQWCEQQ